MKSYNVSGTLSMVLQTHVACRHVCLELHFHICHWTIGLLVCSQFNGKKKKKKKKKIIVFIPIMYISIIMSTDPCISLAAAAVSELLHR